MKDLNIKPTIITYNSLLDTSAKSKQMTVFWKLYREMLINKIEPDNYTFATIINAIKYNSTTNSTSSELFNILEVL